MYFWDFVTSLPHTVHYYKYHIAFNLLLNYYLWIFVHKNTLFYIFFSSLFIFQFLQHFLVLNVDRDLFLGIVFVFFVSVRKMKRNDEWRKFDGALNYVFLSRVRTKFCRVPSKHWRSIRPRSAVVRCRRKFTVRNLLYFSKVDKDVLRAAEIVLVENRRPHIRHVESNKTVRVWHVPEGRRKVKGKDFFFLIEAKSFGRSLGEKGNEHRPETGGGARQKQTESSDDRRDLRCDRRIRSILVAVSFLDGSPGCC